MVINNVMIDYSRLIILSVMMNHPLCCLTMVIRWCSSCSKKVKEPSISCSWILLRIVGFMRLHLLGCSRFQWERRSQSVERVHRRRTHTFLHMFKTRLWRIWVRASTRRCTLSQQKQWRTSDLLRLSTGDWGPSTERMDPLYSRLHLVRREENESKGRTHVTGGQREPQDLGSIAGQCNKGLLWEWFKPVANPNPPCISVVGRMDWSTQDCSQQLPPLQKIKHGNVQNLANRWWMSTMNWQWWISFSSCHQPLTWWPERRKSTGWASERYYYSRCWNCG